MFFSKIKSPNEVGISPSSTFDERFKDSRYAFSVTKVGIFPLSLLRRFRRRWVGLVGSNVDVSRRCRCGNNVDVGLLCGSAMTMTAMKMVGLECGLTWIIKVLGLEVGVGVGVDEGVEAVGLSGFVIEVVVVVGLPIWCWWAMGLF